ncbi:hypothetical protein LTR86_000476 [Recurvomyces mirabilis]|nr:hypothetical protein LTR86_000476 [Recurvomyces mirabilis]
MAWQGDIILAESAVLRDVSLSTTTGLTSSLAKDATLRFLSLVEIDCLPLHVFVGPLYAVTTSCDQTKHLFSQMLLPVEHGQDGSDSQWWQTASNNTKLGLLVKVESSSVQLDQTSGAATEMLFYTALVAHTAGNPTPPQSPPASAQSRIVETIGNRYELRAIAVCSHLLTRSANLTAPSSPGTHDVDQEAVFLPRVGAEAQDIVHEPPVRKRKSVNDTFDQAAERRKKARRGGGGGVAAAAAVKQEFSFPSLGHRRAASGSDSQITIAPSRPLSRSPSISSSRPGTARLGSEAPKRSGLSRVQSVALTAPENMTETRNKEIISRIVMAGMRLYGLSQSKRRKSKTGSALASPAAELSFDMLDAERQQDQEYKVVYHQVYKATCFTFRRYIAIDNLSARSEALRQTADNLLGMFCNDPLKAGLPTIVDEYTPGGRKAFAPSVTGTMNSTALPFATESDQWDPT